MATTFEVFYLGNVADIDPIEGDRDAENASDLVGLTFGTAGDPLAANIEVFEPGSTGFAGGPDTNRYDPNNSVVNETFVIDGGAEQTFDSLATFNGTLTYTDGSTATIRAIAFQDTGGNLYLAPQLTNNSYQAAMEAKAIESLTFDSLINSNPGGLEGNRYAGNYVHSSDGVVQGTSGNDTLTSGYIDSDGDEIDGADGDNDEIDAGAGHDEVNGGAGDDSIRGAAGDDAIDGDTGNDTLVGGTGSDTLSGGTGNDSIEGGDDADLILFEDSFGNDTVDGGEGGTDSDTIDLSGLSGGVTVSYTGDEAGTITDGSDTITFSGIERLILTDQNDSVGSQSSNNTQDMYIDGGGGDDTLYAGVGNSTLVGGTGNDFFDVDHTDGNASIVGGTGLDTLDFDGAATTVTFTGDNAGTYTISGGGAGTFDSVETFFGSDFNDNFDATADSDGGSYSTGQGQDTIVTGGGNDSIYAGDGNDSAEGGAGNDNISGWTGNDYIAGGSGQDTLYGGEGDDTVDGGTGDDVIHDWAGDDSYSGGDGADTFLVYDSSGDDTIVGGEGGTDEDIIDLSNRTDAVTVTYTGNEAGGIVNGPDTVTFSEIERITLTDQADTLDGSADSVGLYVDGGAGNDSIIGGDGADSIYYGDGDNTVSGGDGNDYIDEEGGNPGFTGANLVDAGSGNDTVYSGYGNDTILGGAGNDHLHGQRGSDSIDGGDGNDVISTEWGASTLSGGAGSDTVTGGADDDRIEGGTGNDSLTGAGGDDLFTYSVGDGADTISDFNAGNSGALGDGDTTNNDFIDLSGFYDSVFELRADFDDDGVLNQSNSIANGGTVDYSNNSQMLSGDGLTFQSANRDDFQVDNTGVVCFAAGTRITTPAGAVAVEDLKTGDVVTTMDNGPQRLVWIGTRHVGAAELLARPKLLPLRIKRGVLGAVRPLFVSRQHGMLAGPHGDHFVRAVHLKDMQGVHVARGWREVTYFHLMFEAHQIIFANGAPSESFYPGPQAMRMMAPATRTGLFAQFPSLRDVYVGQRTLQATYGATARPFQRPCAAARQKVPQKA